MKPVTPDDATLQAWAHHAGQAALPLFGAVLVLLLAGVLLLDRAWRHTRVQRWRSQATPATLLAAALAAGFVAVLAAGQAFAELAEAVLQAQRLDALDHAFTSGVQAGTPAAAIAAFALITHLGDTLTLVLLGATVALLLLRQGRIWLAVAWVAGLSGNGLLNWSLKQVFARTRPDHAGGPVQADGYSFPSGHSSGALVAYGLLAYLALRLAPPRWHLAALLAAVTLAWTVAASRVFLRVHHASDVIAGLASGSAWLLTCIGAIELARRGRRRRLSATA